VDRLAQGVAPIRLAADVGGTFTDVVLDTGEKYFTSKIATTIETPETAILEGVGIVLQKAGIKPSQVTGFIHGTTLATNALIERKGARTALITTEGVAPLILWRREYRQDSAGAGKYRGGLGQVIELSNSENADMSLFASLDRIHHPARGRQGGKDGAVGVLELSSGERLRAKGEQIIPGGEQLTVLTPGGAGFGKPMERDADLIEQDLRDGLISNEYAKAHYGVAFKPDGSIDQEASGDHGLSPTGASDHD
jgi:hypothetical protein